MVLKVEFQVSKPAIGAGKKDQYRRDVRSALVQAASSHPKDVQVPLSNNVALASGEVIEILSVQPAVAGTEGAQVWQ